MLLPAVIAPFRPPALGNPCDFPNERRPMALVGRFDVIKGGT